MKKINYNYKVSKVIVVKCCFRQKSQHKASKIIGTTFQMDSPGEKHHVIARNAQSHNCAEICRVVRPFMMNTCLDKLVVTELLSGTNEIKMPHWLNELWNKSTYRGCRIQLLTWWSTCCWLHFLFVTGSFAHSNNNNKKLLKLLFNQ